MAGPLGTLIVVVLKARNLPNKQRIGKQDPYATCTYLSHRKRTKTDKRGGQHPVWDDELRFDIYDNPKDAMASASVSTTATGGVVPVKSNSTSVSSVNATSLKELRVAVFADDPRDPDLIGEGKVDLTETLKKGEFDDWVTVTNKGKYQGEVYLEMTFYSAKPPPDKLQTPTGPIRAGVFEASSPGSGKHPTPVQPVVAHSFNKKHSPSPSCTPSKTMHPDSVPAALRAGRPMSGPTPTGHLPFPGEPSTSKNASLKSRQRSTGSFSMPTPDFGPENRPPSRPPSRNHSLDQSAHLVDSMNAISLSGRPSANNNAYLSQQKPSEPPDLQTSSSHERPYRHSFSGHSHAQNHSVSQSHSVSPTVQNLESTQDRFHEHSTPQYVDPSYPDRFPQSPQPQRATRPSMVGRRPLPIPGGDTVHRPASAWGNSQNISGGQQYVNEIPPVPQQPPPAIYSQYPKDYEHPAVPVMTNGSSTYPPQMQFADGHKPPNGMHPQAPANRPPQSAYSSQQPQYYPTPPPQNPPFAQPGHVPYNLPPPPPGQAPVPIHEVFASSTGRPLPPATPTGYLPPNSFPAQHSQQQQVVQPTSRPNTGGGTAYNYQGSHLDHFQHHNQTYNPPPIENSVPNHNLYQSQNAPPPPPLHPQQQQQQQPIKYQTFLNVQQQPNNSNIQVPIPTPSAPPSTTQMYYHQPGYVILPSSTPETSFNSQHYLEQQHYPEHNNPFHLPPQRSQSVIPGNVYTRPSLESSQSLSPLSSSSNTPSSHLNHPPLSSQTPTISPLFYPSPYHLPPTPAYRQS